jgi:hypothetical protein
VAAVVGVLATDWLLLVRSVLRLAAAMLGRRTVAVGALFLLAVLFHRCLFSHSVYEALAAPTPPLLSNPRAGGHA